MTAAAFAFGTGLAQGLGFFVGLSAIPALYVIFAQAFTKGKRL